MVQYFPDTVGVFSQRLNFANITINCLETVESFFFFFFFWGGGGGGGGGGVGVVDV